MMRPWKLWLGNSLLLVGLLLWSPDASAQGTTKPCKATAGAPTYNEGQIVNESCDLSGNLRTTGGGGGGGNVTILDGVGAVNKAQVNGSNQLSVVCANCSGSGVSQVDNTAFTAGTTVFVPSGGFVGSTAVTAASAGAFQMTTDRNLFVNLNKVGGVALAFGQAAMAASIPVVIASNQSALPVTGTFWQATQPVSGTIAVSNSFLLDATFTGRFPAAAVEADAIANPTLTQISTFLHGYNGATWDRLRSSIANGLVVDVSRVQGTVTVSGTITTTPPSNASTNVAQFGGVNISTGVGASGTGIPRVTVANDSNILATQSGTWNIGTVTTLTGITNALPTGSNTIGAVTGTSANNSANSSLKLPTLPAVANAANPSWTETNQVPLSVDLAGNLRVNSTGGGVTDNSAFTAGSSSEVTAGLVYNDTLALLSAGVTAAQRGTAYRSAYSTLQGTNGLEQGTVTNPLLASLTGVTGFFGGSTLQDPTQTQIATLDPFGRLQSVSTISDGSGRYAAMRGAEGAQLNDAGIVTMPSVAPALQCPYVQAFSQTASATIVTNSGGKMLHICWFGVVSATAQSFSLVEGTGTVCATGIKALYGSTGGSAAFAGNGGLHAISDRITLPMQVPGDNLCVVQSSNGNMSGTIVYGIY